MYQDFLYISVIIMLIADFMAIIAFVRLAMLIRQLKKLGVLND